MFAPTCANRVAEIQLNRFAKGRKIGRRTGLLKRVSNAYVWGLPASEREIYKTKELDNWTCKFTGGLCFGLVAFLMLSCEEVPRGSLIRGGWCQQHIYFVYMLRLSSKKGMISGTYIAKPTKRATPQKQLSNTCAHVRVTP